MKHPSKESHELTEHFFRHSYSKMVSVLINQFGLDHMAMVEDIVQDALVSAMEQWSVKGVPQNPGGWLMQVAKHKSINAIQRKQTYARKVLPTWSTLDSLSDEELNDNTLKMIFTCCHPELSAESQVALALKTLCGLSVDEIASALLTSKSNINKRLYRAKEKFRTGSISHSIPTGADLVERLSNVCTTLFLLFNEGYYSAHHEDTIRMELCYEAIRLMQQMEQNYPTHSESKGLLALMLFNVARFESRLDDEGGLLILADQDRGRWDRELIAEGLEYLNESLKGGEPNTYQLMAGIAVEHCLASDFLSTNWESILKQYQILLRLSDSILIQFNALIAKFYAGQKKEAVAQLTALSADSLFNRNPLFFMTLAVFHSNLGDEVRSHALFLKARDLARSDTERSLVKKVQLKYQG